MVINIINIAVPVPNIKAVTIADALAKNVIAIYGAPRVLLSDQAPALIGMVIQKLGKIFKIEQVTTFGYHPQTNGSLERTHLSEQFSLVQTIKPLMPINEILLMIAERCAELVKRETIPHDFMEN